MLTESQKSEIRQKYASGSSYLKLANEYGVSKATISYIIKGRKSTRQEEAGMISTRIAEITRETKETIIKITLNLDGEGRSEINTTIKFFDHLLILLAKHGDLDLQVSARGDLQHHLVEDVGIALGQAFLKALGKKVGIERYGFAYVPMDESLARVVVDFSGRPYVVLKMKFLNSTIEDMQTEDCIHFLESFGTNALMNLHAEILSGENDHHKIEAIIKALARAIKQAVKVTGKNIPSTKGQI